MAWSAVPRGIKKPLWSSLPQRLLDARDDARLAMRDLANLAEVDHAAVSRIENGQAVPAVDTVERLAAGLGVDPCWLAFGWDGERPFAQRTRRLIPVDPRPAPEGPLPFRALHLGIAERLTLARKAQGLSMRKLAEAAGLSVQAVSLTESGSTVLLMPNLEALAVALDVSPCWLAFGVGQPPPSTAS